jgi:hypothetical protein
MLGLGLLAYRPACARRQLTTSRVLCVSPATQQQVGLTGLCLSLSTPLCCAVFPQEASIK